MNAPKKAATAHVSQPACDFLQFLQAERGIDAAQALDLLGNWLVGYEPGPVALSHARALPDSSRVSTDHANCFAEAAPATTRARKKMRKSSALAA
jgi:hypothetical protein